MARLWITRIMLGYSMLVAIVLVLSIPRPSLATPSQLWTQGLLLAVSTACLAGLVLLTRRPRIGWRIAGWVGLVGVLMLGWRGWAWLQFARDGGAPQRVGALVTLSLWLALAIAGFCSLGRGRQSSAGRLTA